MNEEAGHDSKHHSPRAVLIAMAKICALNLLQPIENLVKIRQKTVVLLNSLARNLLVWGR